MTRTTSPNVSSPTLLEKAWREIARPFRARKRPKKLKPRQRKKVIKQPRPPKPVAPLADFDVNHCTVEPEGLQLLIRLVKESAAYPGPIIEIGTLVGITAVHMALAKRPDQQIITVDNYSWNPWQLPPHAHFGLARLGLLHLIETKQVQQIRMPKDQFYGTYKGPPPALVFLDAIHTYEETKKDIEWAQRIGAKLIAGHDYSDLFPGVMQIVDELGGPRERNGSVWVLHADASASGRRMAA